MYPRPFELKCFKEPKKISRKQLYSLYTRPLKQKNNNKPKQHLYQNMLSNLN